MTNDVFNLTPIDVRAQEFQRAWRGYDRAEVDAFRQRVADALEAVLRERAKLDDRLQNFQEQLRAFREREKAMNEALVASQQLLQEARQQAEREAESILRQAHGDSARILSQAREEENQIRERQEALSRHFAAYLANFRALLERQLGEIEGLQTHAQLTHQVQTELVLKRHA
jgi:DivIVA domain-containing protein